MAASAAIKSVSWQWWWRPRPRMRGIPNFREGSAGRFTPNVFTSTSNRRSLRSLNSARSLAPFASSSQPPRGSISLLHLSCDAMSQICLAISGSPRTCQICLSNWHIHYDNQRASRDSSRFAEQITRVSLHIHRSECLKNWYALTDISTHIYNLKLKFLPLRYIEFHLWMKLIK